MSWTGNDAQTPSWDVDIFAGYYRLIFCTSILPMFLLLISLHYQLDQYVF